MKCPICAPHANSRRATHCPVGHQLFREYRVKAEAFATAAIAAKDGRGADYHRMKTEKDEAQARYRAHVHQGWLPARDEPIEPEGDAA